MVQGLQNGAIGFRFSLYSTTQRKTGTSSEYFTANRAGGSPLHYPLNSIFCTTQSQGSYLVTQTVSKWGTFICSLHKIILSTFVTGLNVLKQQNFISNCASTLYEAFWGGKLALYAIIYIIINLSCWYNNKTWFDFSCIQ